MGVYEARGQLGKSLKELQHRWAETKSVWDDKVSQQFEENFLFPLEMDMKNAVSAMDRIGILLQAIKRDCAE